MTHWVNQISLIRCGLEAAPAIPTNQFCILCRCFRLEYSFANGWQPQAEGILQGRIRINLQTRFILSISSFSMTFSRTGLPQMYGNDWASAKLENLDMGNDVKIDQGVAGNSTCISLRI